MHPDLPRPVARALRALSAIEDSLLVFILVALVVMAGAQIFLRNVFGVGIVDMDSLTRLMVLWLAMFGAVVASRKKKHINVDVLSPRLPKKARAMVAIVIDLFTAGISIAIAVFSTNLLVIEWESGATVFASVPSWLAVAILPVAFGLMFFHYSLHIVGGIYRYRKIGEPQ
ncbi:MAG: TRAP transporter small permease [Acidiferrobacterales bacterium]